MATASAQLKPGDAFLCQACGRDSVAKVKRVMDGWTFVGEVLTCAFCGEEIGSGDTDDSTEHETGGATEVARLAAFLDDAGAGGRRPGISASDAEKRFCRDCRHYLVHPFVSRCLLHDRDVEPMDDCEDYSRRLEDEGKDEAE